MSKKKNDIQVLATTDDNSSSGRNIAVTRVTCNLYEVVITAADGTKYTYTIPANGQWSQNGDLIEIDDLFMRSIVTDESGNEHTIQSLLSSWNTNTNAALLLLQLNNGAEGNYSLGAEDYIILPFSTAEPVNLNIGDYVDLALVLDEAQGKQFAKRYEVCELPKPTLNISTGGYDYELRLDAYYMKWKNKLFRYIAQKVGLGEEVQGESSWTLTATLDIQMEVFLRNLTSLGYTYNDLAFTYDIDWTFIENKARLCSYQDMNMIDALSNMAEVFECEWWVTDNIIHFGKCEEQDLVQVQIGVEAESMNRIDSSGTFATRIYAFGSERNLQSNYRETTDEVTINGVVQRRLMLPEDVPFIDAWRYMADGKKLYTSAYKVDNEGNKIYVGDTGYDADTLKEAEVYVCGYKVIETIDEEGMITLSREYVTPEEYAAATPMTVEEVIEGVIQTDDIYPRTNDTVKAVSVYWKLFDPAIENDSGTLVYDDIDPSFVGQTFDPKTYPLSGVQYLQSYWRVKSTFFEEKFDYDYILSAKTLSLIFSSGKLNGMNFEVMFLGAYGDVKAEYTSPDGTQWFELIVNENYGRLLPDETLCPEVGDTFVLYNWQAIDIETGEITDATKQMIAAAERELLAYAIEYLWDTMVDDGVYECEMNPAYVYGLDIKNEADRWAAYVKRTFSVGQRILLVNDALFDIPRESRIIGFKINIDIPYDHPIYKIGESVQYSRIGSVEDKVNELIYNGNSYSSSGGNSVYLIKTNDRTAASDSNAYSAARALIQFLRKDQDDETAHSLTIDQTLTVKDLMTAMGKIIAHEGIQLGGTFVQGLLGEGGCIDGKGYGEMRGLTLWEWLEVPELRYNRVSINTGITWQTFGGGIIESVEIDTDDDGNELASGVITLKLEDGEYGAIALYDLCMGIFHNYDGENDSESEDQHNGNFHFAGFETSYFRVDEILDTERNSKFHYVLRGTSDNWKQLYHPQPYMHFAAYANPNNTERQTCIYSTTDYLISLYNMTTWEYGENNIYYIRGMLDGFSLNGTEFSGTGIVIGNGYFYGTIQQFENMPFYMAIELDVNDYTLVDDEMRKVTCKVYKGGIWDDRTEDVTEWSVARESGNASADNAWADQHKDFQGEITISYSDLGSTSSSTLFRFTATLADGTEVVGNVAFSTSTKGADGKDASEVQINILLRTGFLSDEKIKEAWEFIGEGMIVESAIDGRNAICLSSSGNVYYRLVNGTAASVVVIDGASVTIPAGETVSGWCMDITGFTTNNLKEIYIDGNFTASLALSSSATNSMLEKAELTYSKGYEVDLWRMFYGYTALQSLSISNCTASDIEALCYNCSSLVEATFEGVDVSNCKYLNSLFYHCSSLLSVDVSKWDTSSCTDMSYIFYHCELLPSIDVSGWDTSKVTTMVQMFGYCYGITSLDLSGFNTSSCTEMNGMFREELALVTLDLSGFDTSKVTAFNAMFRQSYALTNLYLGDHWDMGAATNVANMFMDCSSLTNVTGTISNLKLSLDLSYSPLTRESALVFINGLSSAASGQKLTLSSETKALLTDEDMKIATDKGWTIA